MHKSRFAGFIIDCQTEDLNGAAEFWRKALGAKRAKRVKRWQVMEAPTGQCFCVMRPQRPDFSDKANRWD